MTPGELVTRTAKVCDEALDWACAKLAASGEPTKILTPSADMVEKWVTPAADFPYAAISKIPSYTIPMEQEWLKSIPDDHPAHSVNCADGPALYLVHEDDALSMGPRV